MTAQVHERLIFNGEDTSMACCPDLPYRHPRIVQTDPAELARDQDLGFGIFSTGCYRMYVGTWEVKDGRFFLVGIRGFYKLVGNEPLFADWFTGVLRIPRGEMLNYVHGDFLSVYEVEVRVRIERGVVIETRVTDNRPPSGPAASHYNQGWAWLLTRDHEKAIAAFSKAVQLRADYADAYYARGLGYESLGDYDRSLADLEKVLLLQPGAIQVRSHIGESSLPEVFWLVPWESAREGIDRLIARVRGCRGIAFLQKGEYEKAVADCSTSIRLDPDPGVQLVRLARGKAYRALRRFKEAIGDLQAVAATNPEDEAVRCDLYHQLASCHLEIRSHTQAVLNAGIAIRLGPNNPEPYFVRGRVYLQKGEYDRAITDFTEAIQLRAAWADAYLERAKAYRALGDEIRAVEDVTKAEHLRS